MGGLALGCLPDPASPCLVATSGRCVSHPSSAHGRGLLPREGAGQGPGEPDRAASPQSPALPGGRPPAHEAHQVLRPQPPPSPRPSQRLPSSSGTDLDTSPAMFTGGHSRPGGLCCTPPTALCPGAARRPQAQPRHPGPVGGCSDCPPLCLALQDCPAQPDPEWAAMVPWGHHAGLSPCPSPPPTPRATGPGIFRPPSAGPAGTATGGPAGAARPGAPHRPGRHSPLG